MAGNAYSGRHKLPANLKKELSNMFAARAADIWQVILDKAVGGNLEAAIYAIDREYGRPRQEIDARVKGQLTFSPDDLALMSQVTVTALPVGYVDAEIRELPETSQDEQQAALEVQGVQDTTPDNNDGPVDSA